MGARLDRFHFVRRNAIVLGGSNSVLFFFEETSMKPNFNLLVVKESSILGVGEGGVLGMEPFSLYL